MDYFGGVDPVNSAAFFSNMKSISRGTAREQFETMFFSQILKQAMGEENGLFAPDKSEGSLFANTIPMTDVFMDKMALELSKEFAEKNGGQKEINKR